MCGWGSGKKNLKQICKEKNLQSVTILDPVPREDLAALISAADISIISFIPEMSGISVPSRMYNILAAGCPIIGITEPDSELAQTIFDDDLGWVSPPDKPEKLADLVIQIYERRTELAGYRKRCRIAAKTKFTKASSIRAYYDLLSKVWEAQASLLQQPTCLPHRSKNINTIVITRPCALFREELSQR